MSGQVLSLSTTSVLGVFKQGSTAVSQITVPGGSSTASFTYTDLWAGTPTLTVGNTQSATLTPASGQITVSSGVLASMSLSPSVLTVGVGQNQTFAATGFDSYHDNLGSETGAASWTISPTADGSACVGSTCTVGGVGTHTVTATIGSVTGTATLVGDAPPTPTLTPPSGVLYANDQQAFTVAGTGGGGPLTYTLAFGDGSTASGALGTGPVTVDHTYTQAGSYPVVLQVGDGIAQPDPSTSATVTIAPAVAPTAVVGDPITTTVNQNVQFDASNSTPADGITSYGWNFGDDTTGTGPTPTHSYGSVGTYTATVTVTGHGGLTSQASETVTVGQAADQGAVVTVTDTSQNPLSGASVVVEDAENAVYQGHNTGGDTYVVPGLSDGTYTAYAYAPSFLPATATVKVVDGTGTVTIALAPGQVATTDLTSTQLTATQAQALGIDTSAPGNNFVYQFTSISPSGPGRRRSRSAVWPPATASTPAATAAAGEEVVVVATKAAEARMAAAAPAPARTRTPREAAPTPPIRRSRWSEVSPS